MTTKIYTNEEVSHHNTTSDLWIIIHGGVYDLSKYINEHPGGEEVLLSLAGKDGTTCFDEMGHTLEAIQLRETLKIGIVSNSEGATTNSMSSTINNKKSKLNNVNDDDDDNWEYQEPKSQSSNLYIIFIAILIIIYAIVFNWYLY